MMNAMCVFVYGMKKEDRHWRDVCMQGGKFESEIHSTAVDAEQCISCRENLRTRQKNA